MHNKQQNKNKQQQEQQELVVPQQKVPEFSVAIVFPQYLWNTIHTLQSARESKMVLLKLIQAGLPQPQMATLATKLTALTQRFPSFSFAFDTFVTEPSLSDPTTVQVRLLPTAEGASILCKLNAEMEKVLEVPASSRAFVPFLHISNVPKTQVAAFLAKIQQNFRPIVIPVHDLYFVSRDGKKDFSVQKSFHLAPPNSNTANNNNNNNNNDDDKTGRKDASPPKKELASSPVKKSIVTKVEKEKEKQKEKEKEGVEVGPCFKFVSGVWVAVKEDITNVVAQQFKVATLNVLFDYHDSDKIHTKLRTPATITVLEGLGADVIALEEVTSPFLEKLLSSEWIRANYFISSLDVGYYGQLILSRFSFRSCQILLGKPVNKKLQYTAKKAVVAEFMLNGRSTHVSAVHLTSDKSENSSEKRKLQLSQIDTFMASRGTENFIIGDFNFGDDGDNVLPSGYEDIWPLLRPDEEGFTYDVSNNSLAKITASKQKNTRFDRILSGSNFWTPKSISLFGCNTISEVEGFPLFISDHYGVFSEFEIASRLEIPVLEFSKKSESDPLFNYLKAKNLLADKSYFESRKQVLLFLTEVMEDVFGGEDWKMHLIGSSRFGTDLSGSDMDIVVIGNLARKLFFDNTYKVLSTQDSVGDIRSISDATVPVIKLTLGGVHIDIQYCNIPYGTKLPRSTLDIDDLVVFKMDKASLVALNGVRDSELIVRAVPDLESFRLLVLFIKMWAKERRIYSGSIGFLGGYPVAILAARLYNLNPTLSPAQLVSQFFVEYGAWDLRTTPMSLPGVVFPALDHKKHAVPIFTPTKPVRIATRNGTPATQVVLSREFERGMKIVKNGNEGEALWNELIVPEDVTKYGAYLVLNISTKSESNFSQWAGFVDSRMVDLVIQIEKLMKAKDPAPAVRPCDRKYLCSNTPSLRAYFLVAIDVPSQQCPEIAQTFASSLDFSAFSRGASVGMLISIDVTSDVTAIVSEGEEVEKKRKTGRKTNVTLAPFHSVRATGGLEEKHEEETVKEESPKVVAPAPVGTNNYAVASKVKKNNAIKYGGEFSEKKLRMRTSVEVFNRINWDASLPKEDFIIGFEGIMEVPFNEFDLESIPLHRIRIFKQNGVIVWSRNDRVDSLFKY